MREACWYVAGAATCGFPLQHSESHPPLSKWLIGWGIEAFGHTPLGWRIASVIAGALTVALLYLLARRLLRSTVAASLASGFLAIDTIHFIHSRLALPEVFVTLFGVAAILFCVYDREAVQHPGGTGQGLTGVLVRHPWRVAAGAALGAATAVKWSSLPVLCAGVVLTIVWAVSARQADGRGAALARTVREEGLSLIVWLVLFPFLIYIATFIGTPPGSARAGAGLNDSWIGSVVRQHVYMFQFQTGLSVTDQFQTSPWWWVRLGRPAVYFVMFDEVGYGLVLALGNPSLLVSIAAVAYIAVRAIRRRLLGPADFTILTCFILGFGFVLLTAGRRPPLMYYLLTTIPFMYLALVHVAATIAGLRSATLMMRAWVVLSILYFVVFYPWLVAAQVSHASWRPSPVDLSHCELYRGRVWLAPEPRPC